jgi:hypothetical protein
VGGLSSRADFSAFAVDIPSCVDRIASRFASAPWETEIERARQQFDELRGVVYDDEALFANHMQAFLEWYTLERPLDGGEPPVINLIQRGGLDAQEEPILRALAVSHRSLFEVIDSPFGALRLMDLIGGGQWRVERSVPMEGLEPGDIFEARLIPWEERVYFGPVFCFHPRNARQRIHALILRAHQDGTLSQDIVFALAKMRLKHSRFRNITIDRIYSETFGRKGREP